MTSQDISKTVTNIEWLNKTTEKNPALLCSNSTSAKLFRLTNKTFYKTESAKKKFVMNKGLCIPKTKVMGEKTKGKHLATFSTGSEKNVHSVSQAPDCENFLMGDDSRMLLWNLERPKQEVQSLLDTGKKGNKSGEDFNFSITSAKFHEDKNLVVYSTSQGHVRLCDLRQYSNFDKRCSFEFKSSQRGPDNVFTKYLNAIHEARFVPSSDYYIAARDFLTVKLWDLRK